MNETIPTSLIERCPRNDCASRDVEGIGAAGGSATSGDRITLYTNPLEDDAKPSVDSWVIGPVLKMVAEFDESVKKYPLIPIGTPDPYTPPAAKPEGQ
jgi:hypothetical protein